MDDQYFASYSEGNVEGQILACHFYQISDSSGIWVERNILRHALPTLLFQMVLIFALTRFTFFLLRPLRQNLIVAQIIAGILLGPTFFTSSKEFLRAFFPAPSRPTIRTFGEFGLMIYLFMLGVQTDVSSLRNTSKKAVTIGLWSLFVPFALGCVTLKLLHGHQTIDPTVEILLPYIIMLNSVSSYIVVTALLDDLKILNSELGRLASSAALVTDSIGWITVAVIGQAAKSMKESEIKPLIMMSVTVGFYYTLFFVLRPIIIGIIRRSPNGKTLNESQYFVILIIVLVVGLSGQSLGLHGSFTSFMFGLSLPHGPPLGTHLVKCFGTMLYGFLLPVFYVVSVGVRMDVTTISQKYSSTVGVVMAMGYVGKFLGTILPSLYFKLPFLEAIVLAFIMCTKGVMDIIWFVSWRDRKDIDRPLFSLLMMTTLLLMGITTPMIALLYDPSRRYMAVKRRSILGSAKSWDLRTLVCIYNEDHVSPIVGLLESLSPTRSSPLTVFVLQLKELTGRAAAILVTHHKPKGSPSSLSSPHEQIANAFNPMERRSKGNIVVRHFTAVAPYATMHDDICNLALDKETDIVIVPFHKQWGINGEAEVIHPQMRMVNQHVIGKSPCSVGILIDRNPIHSRRMKPSGTMHTPYHVVMLFLGGPDDFEALALATRMAEHPNIHLTVIQIRSKTENFYPDSKLTKFSSTSTVGRKILYRDEPVTNGVEMTQMIGRIKEICDLVIVGKQQITDSAAVSGLEAWNECPELGMLGDVLIDSDFKFSVLVVQVQPYSEEDLEWGIPECSQH